MDASCPTRRTVAQAVPAPATRVSPKAAGKGAKCAGKPAVNRNFYAGYCYKCGRWGHRSTTCKVA
eukprot:5390737-Heterocapsa_arctica.AAC.1